MPKKPSLRDLLGKALNGFSIQIAYALQLTHGLMGYFPAIGEDNEVVITTSRELIEKVWRGMTPRRSKMSTILVLYDEQTATAYSLSAIGTYPELDDALKRLTAFPVLTESRFAELTAGGKFPFKWAPGLISNDMSEDEFKDTIAAGMAQC